MSEKRYKLLLFSTNKVHNLTLYYLIDTINYLLISKRHKLLLSQEFFFKEIQFMEKDIKLYFFC